jgi:single-stranded DNA-specific DHH superfamily exonuclease
MNYFNMAHAGGRPTLMTEKTVKILEDAFSNAATDIEACFLANISKQTLYNYQEKHPEFIDRKEALKEMVKYQAKRVVAKAINEGDKAQANWWLERKGKDEGFNSRTELTGADGKDLKIELVQYADNTDTSKLPATSLSVTVITGDRQGSEESSDGLA